MVTPSRSTAADRQVTRMRRVTLAVHGLGCGGGGALDIERALAATPGVNRAYVNPLTEMAYIDFDPSVCGPDALVRAVQRAGFSASERDLHVHG